MNFKKQIVDAGNKMLENKWTIETWGNISARDPKTQLVYITPSGMLYPETTEDDILVMKLDGTIVDGTRKPTIETELHLGIYRVREDINAVMHTHPIHSLVFGVIKEDIPPIIDEAAQILGDIVPVTNYALPGSAELAKECIEKLGEKGKALIMAAHGSLCVGENMEMAFKVSQVLEMTAQVYLLAKTAGTPKILDPKDIEIMHHFAYNNYGQGK